MLNIQKAVTGQALRVTPASTPKPASLEEEAAAETVEDAGAEEAPAVPVKTVEAVTPPAQKAKPAKRNVSPQADKPQS